MAKKTRTDAQAAAGEGAQAAPKKKVPSWQEERFIEAFIDNKGNATRAAAAAGYSCPRQAGSRLLSRLVIQEAIEKERERQKESLDIGRDKILRGLADMAFASLDDFTKVWENPKDKRNYRGLGKKRLAIESAKEQITVREFRDGTTQETTEREIRIISPGERRIILNDLWDKLGLGQEAGEGDRQSFLGRFTALGTKFRRGGQGGGSSGGEGST